MRMRRLGGLMVAAATVAMLLPGGGATAGGKQQPSRVQTFDYFYSHGIDTYHYTVSTKAVMPPIVFTPRRGDNWLHLAADDALDKGVLVHVYQRAPLGERDLREVFCGSANIHRLVSDKPIEVHIFSGACKNHNFGFATTGTLTATFARRM